MKAFSSTILSESTKVDSRLHIYDETYMPSLLEQDDMLLQKEIETKRKMFIGLLESLETDVIDNATREAADQFKKLHDERTALNESVIDPYTDDEAGYIREMDDTISRFNIRRHEYEFEAIGQESMIFASEATDYEKFEKLQAVNEAIGAKVKKIFYNTIAKIKEIFAKFMEKLRGNFTTTKHYLDKYKNIILEKPFSNDKYGTQDLPTGIERIHKAEAKRLNLADMDTDLDNLSMDSFKAVFPNNVLSDAAASKGTDFSSAAGQAEFWKTYFCMQNHNVEIIGTEFQRNIKLYWDFLYDIRNIERTIKKSIDDIENTVNTIMKQAGADVDKPTSESVYSYLYQKTFVLEDGVLIEAEKIPAENNNAQQPASTGENPAAGSYSKDMHNVSKAGENDDEKNINTAKQSGRPVMDTRCNNYTICATTMLKAKMSACEFIRSECMQIIRDHVKRYIGGGTNQTPQQNQQQTQQTEKQPATEQPPKQGGIRGFINKVRGKG